jgi:tetratricopeptide (TPR) repeat protein
MDGRIDEADALSFDSLEVGQAAQNPAALQLYSGNLLLLRELQGRMAEIRAVSKGMVDHFGLPIFHAGRAKVCMVLGETEEAARELALTDGPELDPSDRNPFWLSCMTLLADVATGLGDEARAARLYELLLPYADQNVLMGCLAGALGVTARVLGLLAHTLGQSDQAVAHLEHAIRRNSQLGVQSALAICHYDLATVLLARGERARAAQEIEACRELCERHGFVGLLARAGRVLGEHAAPDGRSVAKRARRLRADARAAVSVRGRAGMARLITDYSDDELERRFGSAVAQRALFTAVTRSFQPRMAYGFEGEILFELMHTGERRDRPPDWWTLRIEGDRATARRRTAHEPATVLHLGVPDLMRLISGLANPVSLLLSRRVRAEGDILMGPRLPEMFGGVAPFEAIDPEGYTVA